MRSSFKKLRTSFAWRRSTDKPPLRQAPDADVEVVETRAFGNAISWASAGVLGFKGSKKSTPFAATQATQKAAEQAIARGLVSVEVRIKGPGGGREAAIRALRTSGLIVTKIMDITPIPHNGCRPPKKRRV